MIIIGLYSFILGLGIRLSSRKSLRQLERQENPNKIRPTAPRWPTDIIVRNMIGLWYDKSFWELQSL